MKKLIKQKPNSFSIMYNEHRETYSNVIESLKEVEQGDISHIDHNVLHKIEETGTWVWIRVYPYTPIGFFDVHHYDSNKAIKLATKILKDIKSTEK